MLMLEAVLLVAALSLDAFVASLAFGAEKICVPFSSALVVDLVCSGILAGSLLLGQSTAWWISPMLAAAFSCAILIGLGVIRICNSLVKKMISRCCQNPQGIMFRLHNVRFFLQVCADSLEADSNHSKHLSPAEAISLATALSLDGLAAGFGAGMLRVGIGEMVLLSLGFNLVAVLGGCRLGARLAGKAKMDLSWLGGFVLMGLGLLKLVR